MSSATPHAFSNKIFINGEYVSASLKPLPVRTPQSRNRDNPLTSLLLSISSR